MRYCLTVSANLHNKFVSALDEKGIEWDYWNPENIIAERENVDIEFSVKDKDSVHSIAKSLGIITDLPAPKTEA